MANTATLNIAIEVCDNGSVKIHKLGRTIEDVGKKARKAGDDGRKGFDEMWRSAGLTINKIDKVKGAIVGLAGASVTVALVRFLGVFSDLEARMIGVQKTTDFTAKEMDRFGKSIDQMSLRVPVATASLLDIAGVAGQLGIKGTDNVSRFTETVAKLSLATDIVGEEGAASIARLLNVTGDGIETVDRFGAVLVALGNNSAATESEILGLATEIGQATSTFKVSSAETLALGAAMKSLGVRAELGGSVVGRAMREIEAAIESGGAQIQLLSRVTGIAADDLKRAFGENATVVFQKWIQGIGSMIQGGTSAANALEMFNLKGEEVLKVLPTMAVNAGILDKSLKLANDELQRGTALNIEAAKAGEGLAAQWQIAKNIYSEIEKTIGSALAPAVKGLIGDFKDWWQINNAIVKQDLTRTFGGLADVIRNVSLVIDGLKRLGYIAAAGGTLAALPSVFTAIAMAATGVKTALATMQLAFATNLSVVGALNTSLYGTSVSAMAASGALGTFKVAAGGLFAAFAGWQIGTWLYDNFETARLAGLAMVDGLLKGWIHLEYAGKASWELLKAAGAASMEEIRLKFADMIEAIATGLESLSFEKTFSVMGKEIKIDIGFSETATAAREYADSLRSGEREADKLRQTMAGLSADKQRDLAIHNATIEMVREEVTATREIKGSADQAAEGMNNLSGTAKKVGDAVGDTSKGLTDFGKSLDYSKDQLKEFARAGDDLGEDMWLKYAKGKEEADQRALESENQKIEEMLQAEQDLADELDRMTLSSTDYRRQQLEQQYNDYSKLVQDKALLDQWYLAKKAELADQEDKILQRQVGTYEWFGKTTAGITMEGARAGAEAWVQGEDIKVAASQRANSMIISGAMNLAAEGFNQIISAIAPELGAWLGLGAGKASTKGKDWKEMLRDGGLYLAGTAALLVGAKSIANSWGPKASAPSSSAGKGFAVGGWLGANPNGGRIMAGSWMGDDVYLGLSNGGSVANYGQGGEFVINQETTRQNLGFLSWFNRQKRKVFAEGGEVGAAKPVSDPRKHAEEINAGGFGVFFESWAKSGEWSGWKEGLKNAIIYYSGVFGLSKTAKDYAKDLFREGGQVGRRRFGWGGFLNPFDEDNLLSPDYKPFGIDPTDPLGIKDKFGDQLPGGIGDIWKVDFPAIFDSTGWMEGSKKAVDELLTPWARSVLTPGANPLSFDNVKDGIWDSIEVATREFLEGLLVPAPIQDLQGSFETGTDYVPYTGNYRLHQGEKVTPREYSGVLEQKVDDLIVVCEAMVDHLLTLTNRTKKWDATGLKMVAA